MPSETLIRIRLLEERDLPEAGRIFRIAFGTALGHPDPESMFPGRDLVSTRWRANPRAAFAAEDDGRLVATSFAANWGSFGFFGPLTVRPEYWGRGIAQALLEPTMALFGEWNIEHRGLFTIPNSPKHIRLYEKYGFQAGYLTAIFGKAVSRPNDARFRRLSALPPDEQEAAVGACRALTGEILAGLDVTGEIRAVLAQGLGDACLVQDGPALAAFAVCHVGGGTEAGDGTCFVKFGAVRPSADADSDLGRLVTACEALALDLGVDRLSLGTNMGRRRAYEQIRRLGFRTEIIGVSMETHPERSYNRPHVYVIDDWR